MLNISKATLGHFMRILNFSYVYLFYVILIPVINKIDICIFLYFFVSWREKRGDNYMFTQKNNFKAALYCRFELTCVIFLFKGIMPYILCKSV